MPSTVSTKKVTAKKMGRPKTPGLAEKKRCWHRYDEETLRMLSVVKAAMLKDVPFLFHGNVDDASILAALVHRAHKDVGNNNFKVSDYIIATPASSE